MEDETIMHNAVTISIKKEAKPFILLLRKKQKKLFKTLIKYRYQSIIPLFFILFRYLHFPKHTKK